MISNNPPPIPRCLRAEVQYNLVALRTIDVILSGYHPATGVSKRFPIAAVLNLVLPDILVLYPRHVPPMGVDRHVPTEVDCRLESSTTVAMADA